MIRHNNTELKFDKDPRKVTCAGCEKVYETYLSAEYAITHFCFDCRAAWDINTDKEAEALLAELDLMPVSQRASAKGKKGRKVKVDVSAPKVDKEKIAEALRASIQYGLTTPLAADVLTQPTSYVIARNGLFEVRHTDILDIAFQPKEVIGLTQELTAGIKLNLPKMPYEFLAQTVAFFRGACADRKGSVEAYVQVWYSYADKTYTMHVPLQDVSGGSVRHRGEFDQANTRDAEGRAVYVHVCDIHSHGSSMGGFWSGTDDADEKKAPEGRIFGVIGKVNDAMPDWKWRVRTREGFIDITPDQVFEMPADPIPFSVSWDVVLAVMAGKDGRDDKGRIRLMCPVDPFKEATFPAEWLKQLDVPRHHAHQHGGAAGYGFPFQGGNGAGSGTTSAPFRSYIYIPDTDNTVLEEHEVMVNNEVKATGKKVAMKPMR